MPVAPSPPLWTGLNESLDLLDTLDVIESRFEMGGRPLAKFRRAAAAACAARPVDERPLLTCGALINTCVPPRGYRGLLGRIMTAWVLKREAPLQSTSFSLSKDIERCVL